MGGGISSVLGLLRWLGFSKNKAVEDNLGPDADVPDKVSGLSPRDVYNINKSWDLVKPDMKEHGKLFFLLFFETCPEVQRRFADFMGKSLDELKDSDRLAGHGITVLSAIDSYISNLSDTGAVIQMVKTIGHNHAARGVTVEEFELLPEVLLAYLKDALGVEWTEGAEVAWTKLMDLVTKLATSIY